MDASDTGSAPAAAGAGAHRKLPFERNGGYQVDEADKIVAELETSER